MLGNNGIRPVGLAGYALVCAAVPCVCVTAHLGFGHSQASRALGLRMPDSADVLRGKGPAAAKS